jgi:glycosyltransferase involved in cell wall biosynthesis
MKCFVPLSAKRAHGIISVSDFTKREIMLRYGVPDEKITVTHEGASDSFVPVRGRNLISNTLKAYGIGKKYIVFVGRIEPRKNISGLIKAFAYLKGKGFRDLCLVIVGDQDRLFRERHIFFEIEQMGLAQDIIFTGGVSEQDLCMLYNGAEMLVYPAFAEGFGLPVVEAMACGIPVITSNSTALREVAGDAGVLVNPNSFKEIAEGMERVLVDQGLKEELSFKGLEWIKNFRWQKTAQETIQVYRSVLQG